MDWTPFIAVAIVLLLAYLVIPAGIEIALFKFRCWRVRRSIAREDHALSAHRGHSGVSGRSLAADLHGLSARKRRLDDFNDAA